MRFGQLAASILGLASVAASMQLPRDHYLWGANGDTSVSLQERRAEAKAEPARLVKKATTTKVADAACTNGPLTRVCWKNGYSIATDFDTKWPNTGVVRSYTLEITNGTCNPDGHGARECLLFNKQLPGPTIYANWGDTLKITIKNSMQANGTSVHWHGVRQYLTNTQDGVNGITECPLAPGQTKTYTFQATQFGTSWYHSHHSGQYGDGAFGAIVIDGPASSNYDIDLGAYTVNDWFYQTTWVFADEAEATLVQGQAPPDPNTVLINGTNKNADGGGSYNKVTLTKGKKYRLRLINASSGNAIRVSLDNHVFTVIAADFVPVKAYTTNWVLLAIGQRYDVVFTANQNVDNYWFRAVPAQDCASNNEGSAKSIFHYSGAANTDPTSTQFTLPTVCQEPAMTPYVSNTVPRDQFASQVVDLEVDITRAGVSTNGQNIVFWGVNMSGIDVNWDKPTLQYVLDHNTSYPSVYNLIEIPNQATWTYWIIQETAGTFVPIPHPIHLHGHDFYILGSGSGVFNKTTSIDSLTFNNPMRRDVSMLPGGGWLAIAFPADNPGAWLMHCHISWHIGEGLGVQFLESKAKIPLPNQAWKNTCNQWRAYDQHPIWAKTDSGL